MQNISYKLIEFFIAFIIVPISFVLNYPVLFKMIIGCLGFLYVLFVLLRIEKNEFKIAKGLNWKLFWKQTLLKLLAVIVLTTIYVWIFDKTNLFSVVLSKPLLWLAILFIYSVFSVYPQELIFRTFFFQRYETLFSSKTLLIFVNAIVFCLAHLFFRNTLVLVLTFLGGLLFGLTFYKTKSTLFVTIEHAIYGCWLFTVGMGEMLGFPN
ncbi:MAG: type II CAAX endopeptidase family protein [Flavobacteriaceae bacterium]